jgi:hypothetical protein
MILSGGLPSEQHTLFHLALIFWPAVKRLFVFGVNRAAWCGFYKLLFLQIALPDRKG